MVKVAEMPVPTSTSSYSNSTHETDFDPSDNDHEYEDCESSLDESLLAQNKSAAISRHASVILRDGRRVRRSVTMTSLRAANDQGSDHDIEGASIRQQRSTLSRYCSNMFNALGALSDILIAPSNRGLVKCVVAYFIASLAVFLPQFSDFIGHGDGKHFVATCTVYFHPSRSTGSMIQATCYAILALAWAVFISVSSMATAIGFNQIHYRSLGHAVVLIVYVCGGIGYIAYWKQRMGDPTVGVAASMASMMIFFNTTREGSIQLGQFSTRKVLQYFFIVTLGLIISNLVNYLLWPVSATYNLKRDMFKTTTQFSHLLSLVTRRFLQRTPSDSLEKSFKDAVTQNQTVFASLQKNLKESRYEYYLKGREAEFDLMENITRSMKNLAQHLNALKASCDAQIALMSESHPLNPTGSEAETAQQSTAVDDPCDNNTNTNTSQNNTADALISSFVYHLGPPMKSLAYTTKHALKEMPFDENNRVNLPSQLFLNIDRALTLYSEARDTALDQMYQHRPRTLHGVDEIADREEVAASMDYFSHSLQEFVCETRELMYHLKDLEVYQATTQQRSWRFLYFWRRQNNTARTQHVPRNTLASKRQKLGTFISDTWGTLQFRLWQLLRRLKSTQIKFAIKVGAGAALFALPAMVDSLRPFFVEWRLEWGLLSFFIVLSSSVGGTYSAAFWRITGSALGTALAMLAWSLFPGRAFALVPIGACIAAPCLYMIINPAKANPQLGRFILLSYNLTALYAYSISNGVLDDDDDEGGLRPIITLIALHRIVSVTAGCIWGAIVNTYVWPVKARVELREGLSMVWLRLGWKWRRDPFVFVERSTTTDIRMVQAKDTADDNMDLQNTLADLKSLLVQCPNEPRLRGRFPVESYSKLLKSTQDIMDATYAMSTALQKSRDLDPQEQALLATSRRARRELGDMIFLHFYILGSAIRLNLPLPLRSPRVSEARDRLLVTISEVRSRGSGKEQDYSASFIYTLMTAQLCHSLEDISNVITELFGHVESFDLEKDHDDDL